MSNININSIPREHRHEKLIKTARAIAHDPRVYPGDREDWASIAEFLERGDNESAATGYRLMDTASRDYLDDVARADADVKAQASEALSIQWLF